mmetsp:Transcript_12865/g.19343  ORF Transcript_12865/g.19343 Transcript_12865/m.19343 type:complete len:589 (+) Transcript_12865:85-1851(+)
MGNQTSSPKQQQPPPTPRPPRRPNYSMNWNSRVIGMERAKRCLDATLSLPAKFPTFCQRVPPVRSVLLWGPPGTGKTMLAKAFAEGTGFEFVIINPGNTMNAYWGETPTRIKRIFDAALRTPTVIFIDELDAFGSNRRGGQTNSTFMLQILTQLLQSMQDLVDAENCKSVLIGCTNLVCELDDAIRRRFTSLIFCDLPNAQERCELMKTNIPAVERDVSLTDDFLLRLAEKMELFSGSDIKRFVNYAREAPQIEIQSATHFRRNNDNKWEPCSPTDHGAEEMTLQRMGHDELNVRRRVTSADFERVLESCLPTLTQSKYGVYLKELGEIGGGDLSRRVGQVQDTVQAYNPSRKEAEIDRIFFSRDLPSLSAGQIIQEASASISDPLKQVECVQKFIVFSADTTSESHKVCKQIGLLVMILLWIFSFIPQFIWIVATLVSLLVLANVVIIPLKFWYISMHSGANTDMLTSQLETAKEYLFIFLISGVLCVFNFVHITYFLLIDVLVLTWIFHSIQTTVVAIAGFMMFASRQDVKARCNYVKRFVEQGHSFAPCDVHAVNATGTGSPVAMVGLAMEQEAEIGDETKNGDA